MNIFGSRPNLRLSFNNNPVLAILENMTPASIMKLIHDLGHFQIAYIESSYPDLTKNVHENIA